MTFLMYCNERCHGSQCTTYKCQLPPHAIDGSTSTVDEPVLHRSLFWTPKKYWKQDIRSLISSTADPSGAFTIYKFTRKAMARVKM
jgi:hypothetical protein